MNIRKRWTLS